MADQPTRIFLVDDHPLVRECLTTLLRRRPGMEVCGEAGDHLGAVVGIERAAPDVVIVDLSLNGDSGIELLRDLQERHPEVALIVLSMHEDDQRVEQALRAGARGYVMKGEATGRIVEAVRGVQEGRIYVNAETMNRLAKRLVGRKAPAGEPVGTLSEREKEVFRRLGRGRTTREIADELNLSIKTIETHRAHIKEKLVLASARDVARLARDWVGSQLP